MGEPGPFKFRKKKRGHFINGTLMAVQGRGGREGIEIPTRSRGRGGQQRFLISEGKKPAAAGKLEVSGKSRKSLYERREARRKKRFSLLGLSLEREK